MGARLITMLVLIYAGFSALGIAAGITIVRKAGYSPWWVVTGFIPLVNIVMAFTFAFADWPVLQESRRAQRAAPPKVHPSLGYASAPGTAGMAGAAVATWVAEQPSSPQFMPPQPPRPYGT